MTFTGDFTGTRTLDIAPGVFGEGSMFADRYAIEKRLGAGAQGTVYAALDMQVSPPQRVALKIAHSNAADEMNLEREAAVLERIHRDGPVDGVVRLVEPGVQAFGVIKYLVIEHIDGPTFRNKQTSIAEVCRFGRAIARTLSIIHKVNIVVTDIKPDNIVLRHGIEPVLVDFGAARDLHDSKKSHLLTPAYASPEQHLGNAPTPASDVYALAVVLEEMAGPHPPKTFLALTTPCKHVIPTERPTATAFSQSMDAANIASEANPWRFWPLGILSVLLGIGAINALVHAPSFLPTKASPSNSRTPRMSKITAPGQPAFLTPGATHVYGTNGSGNTVFRVSYTGSESEVVTPLDAPAHQLAISGQTLFIRSPGRIWTLTNGKLEPFAESTGRGGIVTDDRDVAWTNEVSGDVAIASVRNDRPLRVLASQQSRPYSIAMNETHVYWANEENGTIARVSRPGGEVEMLVHGQSWPGSIVLDETHLYWMDRTVGAIWRVLKGGGSPQLVTNVSIGSISIALDETHVYWTSTEDGRVLRVPKVGGIPEVLAIGQERPHALVVRAKEVIFSNVAYGGLIRLTLP